MMDGKKHPLSALSLRYHGAMPDWCKVVGLRIRAVPECEGGGFAVDRYQAEALRDMLPCPGLLREARDELNVIASYEDDSDVPAGLRATARAYRRLVERIDAVLPPHL